MGDHGPSIRSNLQGPSDSAEGGSNEKSAAGGFLYTRDLSAIYLVKLISMRGCPPPIQAVGEEVDLRARLEQRPSKLKSVAEGIAHRQAELKRRLALERARRLLRLKGISVFW